MNDFVAMAPPGLDMSAHVGARVAMVDGANRSACCKQNSGCPNKGG